MKQIKNIIVGIALITAIPLIFTSCSLGSKKPVKTGDNSYIMENPLAAQQYISFLNKEIEPVTNQLIAHLTLSSDIIKGNSINKDSVLQSARDSLVIIEESKKMVEEMPPAPNYSENRDGVIKTLTDISNTFNAYIKELENDKPDIKNLEKLNLEMKDEYTILTSEFLVIYE